MNTIDISKLSTPDLTTLISVAMQEYQRRLEAPQVQFVPAKAKRITVVTSPDADQLRFIVGCLTLLKKSGFVRAEERSEYKQLAAQFEKWFKQKGYPLDVNKSGARHWLDFGGYIG